jgi:2-polyprenyl-3-methyl-5-hydroxy-6-metoxy-1,4-benzoquinol methylase
MYLRKVIGRCYQLSNKILGWRYDWETRAIRIFFKKYISPQNRILDVGCGYGRNMRTLLAGGYSNVTGVDVNPEIVKTNLTLGLNAMTAKAFQRTKDKFDAILLSHVVEHFAPEALLKFLDDYLNRLAPGGYLIIATPLHSAYFYDDFDHVKPYQPTGFLQILGGKSAQIQYYSKHQVELTDLWFRKNSLEIRYHKHLYIRGITSPILHAINFTSHILFLLSFRLLGKTDGWLGVFKKK